MTFSIPPSHATGIHSLTLQNFRGYGKLDIVPEGRSVILTGPNGAGKTNVLEAISLLFPGRGLRRARLSDMLRQGSLAHSWTIQAHLNGLHGPVDLSTTAHCGPAKERRSCTIFQKPEKTLTALAQQMSVIWLTPQMDRLFTDGMSAKRRFIDRLCVALHPSHNDLLAAYETLLKERLAALLSAPDPHWLSALEQQIATAGLKIYHTRQEVSFQLNAKMEERFSAFPCARIYATGEENIALSTAADAHAFYVEKLTLFRSLDRQLETTSFGPHRFALDILHVDKNLGASYCSTGEQKALLLAIILAFAGLMKEYSRGVPVLLLDEVAAHLDEEKRAHLFNELWALKMQIWMTGTDLSPFLECESQALIYHVEQAAVTKR
jgi:DNA replication and repair protein RecF